MRVVALTGGIAMGKSRVTGLLRAYGIPVFDADAAVHAAYAAHGPAVVPVVAAFGDVRAADGGIDRKALSAKVLGDPGALARLERIVHPIVRRAQRCFVQQATRAGHDLVVLDIPLLFETKGQRRVDTVVTVSTPGWLQTQRALRRPGMTRERLDRILAQQVPDRVRRRLSDHVLCSSSDQGWMVRQLAALLEEWRRGPSTS